MEVWSSVPFTFWKNQGHNSPNHPPMKRYLNKWSLVGFPEKRTGALKKCIVSVKKLPSHPPAPTNMESDSAVGNLIFPRKCT